MLLNHYRELALHYKLILVALVVIATLSAFVFSRYELRTMPIYTSSVRVSLQPGERELSFARSFVPGSEAFANSAISQTHIESIKSSDVATRTVDRLFPELSDGSAPPEPVLERYTGPGLRASIRRYANLLNFGEDAVLDPRAEKVSALMNSVDAEMIEGTFILRLSVAWNDPEIAAAAANALAEVYSQRMQVQAIAASGARQRAVERELASLSEDLVQARTDRTALERELGIFDLRAERQALLTARETERSRLADAISDLHAFEDRHRELTASRETLRLAGRESIVSEGMALQAVTRAELESRVNARRAQLEHIDQNLQALRSHLDSIDALSAEIEAMEQEHAELNRLRTTLRLNRDNVAGGRLSLIEAAAVPVDPSSPKVLLQTVIAAIASVTIGAFAIVSIDTLTNTVKTSADLDRLFGNRGLGRVRRRQLDGAGLPRATATAIGRRLRLRGTPDSRAGAVMAFGSDADAEAAARAVDAALDFEPRPDDATVTRHLGGLAQSFSLSRIGPEVEWLVVAMRPAEAAESDVTGIVEEARNRGVRTVFGILLAP